ncbi:MAG: LamG-like jellyroll fold domain-containing protein, partial [Gemmataceae bacterium]
VTEGSVLGAGTLRLARGRATLVFFNGVTFFVEGPAEFNLLGQNRVFCHRGKLRTRVPDGAKGFTAMAPGAAVVDLGTEFAMNVDTDGGSDVMVFEGQAEISLLNREGHTLRSETLEHGKAARIDSQADHITAVTARPEQFANSMSLIAPPLELSPAYPQAVLAAKPWSYWRFETMTDQTIPNEMADRPPLRVVGAPRLTGSAGGNHHAVFPGSGRMRYLLMDDAWTPPQRNYAVECWLMPEKIRPSALISLLAESDEPGLNHHAFLLELTGPGSEVVHPRGALRFLHRMPAGTSGGTNVFSRGVYVPYRWQHVVAQRIGEYMELYLDGNLVGTAPLDKDTPLPPCRLLLGWLRLAPEFKWGNARPFVGGLDEVALYDHPLSAQEIQQHYQLGSTKRPSP